MRGLVNYVLNKYVYLLAKASQRSYLVLSPREDEAPFFLMGMFRSGTSLTSRILEKSGVSFGKSYRMLKSQGSLKDLNPDGFYEDFLFAQLSRYLFEQVKKDGSNPPSPAETADLVIERIKLSDFILYSFFTVKEDRISVLNKIRTLTLLRFGKMKYLTGGTKMAVKVPMLVPFHRLLKKIYPNSSFLIILRNPDSTIRSSKVLTEKSGIALFNQYYIHLYDLYNEGSGNTIVFSYDRLLEDPERSVQRLTAALNLHYDAAVPGLIKSGYIRNQVVSSTKSEYYDYLFGKAVNGD